MKRLSIITINYNNLQGLKKTVASVVGQTWKEFEYIVIDGGSTDGSAVYIADQKEHFDYWVSEPDLGIYNAMNKGIVKASGEYLLFLNSGDLLFQKSVLEQNFSHLCEEDLICFDILMKNDNSEFIKSSPKDNVLSYLALDTFPHQSVLIKRELFEKVGLYDENLKIVSDWKFFLYAIVFHKATYKTIEQLLSVYQLDGISSQPANFRLLIQERYQVLNNEFPYLKELFDSFLKKDNLVSDLRKSRKLNLLIKLGLLNRF